MASDISHTMMDWDTYILWNNRLFRKLYSKFVTGESARMMLELCLVGGSMGERDSTTSMSSLLLKSYSSVVSLGLQEINTSNTPKRIENFGKQEGKKL